MAAQNRRGGCGCCGCLFAILLILFALILLGVGFVYFSATNKPSGIAATAAVLLPSTTFTRQTYIAARQKFNQFFADPAERRITRIGIQSDCEPVLHYDPCNPTPSS